MNLKLNRVLLAGAMIWAVCLSARFARAQEPATEPAAGELAKLQPIVRPTDDRDTVYLARPDPIPVETRPPSLLLRELHRQSLLMAARDGMGLYTRDEVLREFESAAPHAPPALRLDVGLGISHAQVVDRCMSAATQDDDAAIHATSALVGVFNEPDDYRALVYAEEASRNVWPSVLRQAGYAGTVPADNDGPAPVGVDSLLYRTTLLAPFAAVQRTHAAIRRDGASPARLSALARGYANLGLLTRFHWSADRQVFMARSLLYGRRMVVRWPDQALSYWSEAYAEALAGLHSAALKDVAKARELQPAAEPLPPWAELVEPLCNYDTATLTSEIASNPKRSPLAALCTFLSIEQCGSWALVLEVGDATLKFNPACFHTIDAMMSAAGVGPGARLSALAPTEMALSLPADVQRLPNLPPAVKTAVDALLAAPPHSPDLDEPGIDPIDLRVADVAQALVDAGPTRAEPSFVAAGRLVQETTFVHVERRAYFITRRWGWDGSDYVHAALPLVADHPLRSFIEVFALPAKQRPAALRTLVVDDVQEHMYDLYEMIERVKPLPGKITGANLRQRVGQNADSTAYDLTALLVPTDGDSRGIDLTLSNALRTYSPKCPMIEAARIRDHWELPEVRNEAQDGITKFAQQPATLRALANRLKLDGDVAGAEAALEQYAKIAGDYRESSELADLYLANDDEAHWLATLQAVIGRPDYGLNHAQAQVAIARHFMEKGDYKRALPYADAAEETQAFWAMQCDADCHRAMGDTATADRIMQEAREHYGHE